MTKKITRGLSRINFGLEKCIYMGNLDARRDWSHAKDFVYMQWLMLQQEKPNHYVIATGQMHSVREFIELSGKQLGWNKRDGEQAIIWENSGLDEVGKRADTEEIVVRVDPRYFRPTEVEKLLGDSTKARKELNWEPRINLSQLVAEMIEEDSNVAKKESLLKKKGFSIYSSQE